MSDTKLLQSLVDGQRELKTLIKDTKKEVKSNGKRIDKLGLNLAELADDAPTIEEHDDLKERVDKLENQAASV